MSYIVKSFSSLYSYAFLKSSDKIYKAIETPKNRTLKNAKPNIKIGSSDFTNTTEYKKSINHNIASIIESFAVLFCILMFSSQNGLFFLV